MVLNIGRYGRHTDFGLIPKQFDEKSWPYRFELI